MHFVILIIVVATVLFASLHSHVKNYGNKTSQHLIAKPCMRLYPFPFLLLAFFSCGNDSLPGFQPADTNFLHVIDGSSKKYEVNSWQYFLQHLPVVDKPIVDYKGKEIGYQQKHAGIIPYDVGTSDLQQCADALMRLRAEYLFQQKRFNEIGFHFVSGDYYSWNDYCKGLRPVAKGNGVKFVSVLASGKSHETLRKYLDIVYSYASTISLSKELKTADDFGVGTVIIHAGSPGHCFIIIDEAINKSGKKFTNLPKVIRRHNLFMFCAI